MGGALNEKCVLSGVEHGLAGASSGLVTRFLCQPLDVLKIRLQLQTTPMKSINSAKYTSMVQSVRLIAAEEGITALWKGHNAAQLLSISFGAAQFSTYEKLYELVQTNSMSHSHWAEHFVNIGCGSVAGLIATVISFPFDVIRTHLVFQGEPKIYKGLIDAGSQIYQKEGLRGFGKGLGVSIIQTAPMSGLTFSFKGIFRDIWFLVFAQIDARTPTSMSTSGTVVTSLLAGVCAKTIVYPLDLVKKRLQIQGFDGKHSCSKEMIVCSGMVECLLKTVKVEGFLGLFKGVVPSVIKAGASTAIYFTMYDKACSFIAYSKG